MADYLEADPQEFALLCGALTGFRQCVSLGALIGAWAPAARDAAREPFLAAVRRLCAAGLDDVRCTAREGSVGDRIRQLLFLSRRLGFPEAEALARALTAELPARLAREEALLSAEEDRWHSLDAPHDLGELLDAICVFDEALFRPVLDRAVSYMCRWFSFAYSYQIGDFLALAEIPQYGSVSVGEIDLPQIREALEDYLENIFPDEVDEIDYEDEGRQYLADLITLETLLGRKLDGEKGAVWARLYELEEEADEEEDDEEDQDDEGPSETAEILDLFESLRDREPGGGGECSGS